MGTFSMEWRLRFESSGNTLTDAHQNAFHEVADLFDHQNPRNLATYRTRAEKLERSFDGDYRNKLVDALTEHMKGLGAAQSSLNLVEKLRDTRCVAVVTGQQAGLFTGPLYALYKALSAIGIAEQLERELGKPVVPVFWVASEDHDWGEVNHAYIMDTQDEVKRIRLTQEVPVHQMVYHTPVSPEHADLLCNDVERLLPEGPFKTEVLRELRETYRLDEGLPGATLSDWFARLLLRMLEPKGIVLVDPCLPSLRELVAPVWETALRTVDEGQRALEAAYTAVEQGGYTPLVVRDRSNSNVFYVQDGQRYVLERAGEGRLRARALGIEKSVEEWVEIARATPHHFSSNVLLRPVVQDALLPTLTYVGGPAEISYHTLARGLFSVHDRTLPPLNLRHRVRVFTPPVLRHMDKWGIEVADLSQPMDESKWLRNRLDAGEFEKPFEYMLQQANERWAQYRSAFEFLGPQIGEMAGRHMKRELDELTRLQRKTERMYDILHQTELRQLQHINRWIWTNGPAQERRLSPLNIWATYGLSWLVESDLWNQSATDFGVYDVFVS